MTKEMRASWLVQRLKKPYRGPTTLLGKDNPFAFGGGYKNGGLSDDAMDLLRELFSFDYMGSAEFEFGAVPEAFREIAKQAEAGKLTARTLMLPLAEVAANWKVKDDEVTEGDGTVYVLCNEDWTDEVAVRIREWAAEKGGRLKERPELAATLRPYNKWDGDVVGWVELDNGFMFFTDRKMWESTCRLFGVETEAGVK